MSIQLLRRFATVLMLVSFLPALYAQEKKTTPKPIQWKQVGSWKSIQPFSVELSPDGKWMAYAILTVEGDGELIIQKLRDTVKRSYPIGGSPSFSFEFSDDSKWIAFKEFPKDKDRKAAAKSPGKQLFDKLHLVNLSNWKKTEYEKAGQYVFNGKTASHLAIQILKERNPTAKPDDGKGTDLMLVNLSNQKSMLLGNVSEFAFNKDGNWLAFTTDANGMSGNGLSLLNVASSSVSILDNDKATYRSLGWNEDGTAFALLKMFKDDKYKVERGVAMGVKNMSANPDVFIYDAAKDSISFPKDMTISPNRRPIWTDDLTRVLFGIHALEPVKKEEPKPVVSPATTDSMNVVKLARIRADTSIKTIEDLQKAIAKVNAEGKPAPAAAIDTVRPDMTIWHWQDKRLQSRQQVVVAADKNFNYWSSYDVVSKKFIRLHDSTMRNLSPMPKHIYAFGSDNTAYELDENLDGQTYQDVYLVNMNTGEKTKLFDKFYATNFSSTPRASWDGTKFVFGKDGNYHVYDITTKSTTNITEKIGTSFINTEDDHNTDRPLTPLLGWSSDSKYLLIRDLWDMWLVSANGKEAAVNLTQNGKSNGIRYQTRYIIDEEEKGFDVKKPLYVRMYGEWTKKSGFGKINADKKGLQPGVQVLKWEDAALSGFAKSKKADVFQFSREKFNQPTEFFVADAGLTNETQVTKNAPDAEKYTWSSGVQLVDYVSDKGDKLQGALFLPAGYEKGKKYPTIIYYYEKLSQTLHFWNNPSFSGTGWNPTMYTSNGYAVFIPDIVYKMDDPGMSAVWCVLPGVKAALATGVIDETKMGIHGHSWGGYQTAFLITQTNMFKAAAAGAPLTNMVSMYDLIYWNAGIGNMQIFESSQGRFKGAPWENWESYLRNSPVYHVKKVTTPLLMLHNDKDGAVDFTQGIEFYNALRRLKKPVVLMQYKGENHGLAKIENRKDYSVRMMEFFDYHLKGAAMPDWLKTGVDHLQITEHLNTRVFEEQD